MARNPLVEVVTLVVVVAVVANAVVVGQELIQEEGEEPLRWMLMMPQYQGPEEEKVQDHRDPRLKVGGEGNDPAVFNLDRCIE